MSLWTLCRYVNSGQCFKFPMKSLKPSSDVTILLKTDKCTVEISVGGHVQ